jgi:probable rRNA maturation factor
MPDRAVSVVFLGAQEMRSINEKYRGKDYATDVLSFAYRGVNMEGMSFLGEIVIAPEVAVKQSARFGIEPERELRKLLVHGVLHLMGFDHESDRGQMTRMQAKLMRRKFFEDPPQMAQLKAKG